MATITESTTTTEDIEYETPVYRKIGTDVFINIFSATKMMVVKTQEGFESINQLTFPGSQVRKISLTEASDETEFTAAYDAAVAAIDLIINPAP